MTPSTNFEPTPFPRFSSRSTGLQVLFAPISKTRPAYAGHFKQNGRIRHLILNSNDLLAPARLALAGVCLWQIPFIDSPATQVPVRGGEESWCINLIIQYTSLGILTTKNGPPCRRRSLFSRGNTRAVHCSRKKTAGASLLKEKAFCGTPLVAGTWMVGFGT